MGSRGTAGSERSGRQQQGTAVDSSDQIAEYVDSQLEGVEHSKPVILHWQSANEAISSAAAICRNTLAAGGNAVVLTASDYSGALLRSCLARTGVSKNQLVYLGGSVTRNGLAIRLQQAREPYVLMISAALCWILRHWEHPRWTCAAVGYSVLFVPSVVSAPGGGSRLLGALHSIDWQHARCMLVECLPQDSPKSVFVLAGPASGRIEQRQQAAE